MKNPTSLAEWGEEFERLLDEGLAVFRPEWSLPSAPARISERPDHYLGWRCNRKRQALANALGRDPEIVRANRSMLLRLIMHDLSSSFNRFLIEPVGKAIGLHDVHEAIIDFMANGSFVEKIGAIRAWYSAQPGLCYPAVQSHDKGDPSSASSAEYADWMALRPRYEDACRRAVATCADPEVRHRLAEEIDAFAEIRRIGIE